MNFLSHYYFERFAAEPEQVLGALLPDLLKNADKSYSFQISRYESMLAFHPKNLLITEGWKRHVTVDKVFHSSDFFYKHTHELRKRIEGTLHDLPIRASFLAHVALELLLDHLLIKNDIVNVSRLYEHLENIDRKVVADYLRAFENVDIEGFFKFYDGFVKSRYIFEYKDISSIPHALYNISKRLWQFETNPQHLIGLKVHLEEYLNEHLSDYKEIYTFIQHTME